MSQSSERLPAGELHELKRWQSLVVPFKSVKKNFLLTGLAALRLMVVLSTAASQGNAPGYQLPAPPLELMVNEQKFVPLAKMLAAEVDRMLAAQPELAREKLLLGLRVHLALHFGENEVALRVAARIRDLQTDPADKAFAGLTTRAAAAAREATSAAPGSPAYGAAFERDFAALLAALPRTPEITAMLQVQREKNAAFSRAALLDEVQVKIAPVIEQRHGWATLEDLDQFVRARHRLTELLPVQHETLQALDEAIAERSHP
jgi:hypothetical protein